MSQTNSAVADTLLLRCLSIGGQDQFVVTMTIDLTALTAHVRSDRLNIHEDYVNGHRSFRPEGCGWNDTQFVRANNDAIVLGIVGVTTNTDPSCAEWRGKPNEATWWDIDRRTGIAKGLGIDYECQRVTGNQF